MSKEAIDYFSYNNPLIKVKTFFSLKARRKMYNIFIKKIKPCENNQILDLGTTPDTKLEDSNFFEQLYPYKSNITIASIEDCSDLVEKYGLKAFCFNESGKPLPFKDKEFDCLFSSAVLEHVGTRDDQMYFIKECVRVADKVFLTTPNRFFPVEMHTFVVFLHWLPWNFFQRIIRHTKGEFWADINNLNLLSTKDAEKLIRGTNLKVDCIRTMGMKSNIVIYGETTNE